MGPHRLVEVDPERIVRWVDGFDDRHHGMAWAFEGPGLSLSGADGALARLEPLRAPDDPCGGAQAGAGGPSAGLDRVSLSSTTLLSWAEPPSALGLVLIRRGGYAVGLADRTELVAHKCGTRYVQSRTAAGGWSQQRFARRRDNQADDLAGAVVCHALRILVTGSPAALVVGGDKALVRQVLADSRLSEYGTVVRREFFDLPDPRLIVLREALRRGRAVRVALSDPR